MDSVSSTVRTSKSDRERIVLDTAARLFYARGVHEVGMDELVRATGLAKASVYRLYPTKDALIEAYLQRLADTIFAEIDQDIATHPPAQAVHRILDAIATDIARPEFRGCPFNNASIEFADPTHPARSVARRYRQELHQRLTTLAILSGGSPELGDQLAVLVDGAYVNAAHLGADGPAGAALELAHRLVGEAAR